MVLELHYWEGMTGADIAEVLELPLGTVKTRLRLGRQLLKEHRPRFSATSADPQHTPRSPPGCGGER